MKALICLAVFLGLYGEALAARLQPSNFSRYAAVDGAVAAGAIYRVDLPAGVLRGCQPGQTDLRLFAPDGTEVPYVLVRSEYLKTADQTYAAEITGYSADGREAVLDFRLNGQFSPVTSVRLDVADRDFRKEAELLASPDGKAWTRLAAGSVYDYSSQVALRRTQLDFPPSAHRFYRLRLRDTEEAGRGGKTVALKYDGIDFSVTGGKGVKLKINGVAARTGGYNSRVGVYDEELYTPSAAGEAADGSSYVAINGGVPFERVEFGVEDAFFTRDFSAWYSETGEDGSYRGLGSGNIYRFPPGWPDGEHAWAELSSPGYPYYKFVFANRNNPPLRVKNVRLKWLRRSLYFIAPADLAGLRLAFGRPGTARPVYDVERFVNQDNWEKREAKELRLGEILLTEGYSPEAPADRKGRMEKNLLTGIIVLVAAGMGYWLYRLLQKASAKPA